MNIIYKSTKTFLIWSYSHSVALGEVDASGSSPSNYKKERRKRKNKETKKKILMASPTSLSSPS